MSLLAPFTKALTNRFSLMKAVIQAVLPAFWLSELLPGVSVFEIY